MQHLSRLPSVVQVCFLHPSLKGGGTISHPAAPYRQNAHTISCRPSACKPVGESEKAHKCPKEQELNESGCSTTGTCPTGVLPARVDSHRACMCNRRLIFLSSHQLEICGGGVRVFVLTGNFFSDGRMVGPQMQPPSAAPVGRQRSQVTSTGAGAFSMRLVRCAPDNCRRGWPWVWEAGPVIGRPG